MKMLQFKTDIDGAFALAYSSLKAKKSLFKRRHARFVEDKGEELNKLMHGANRRQLIADTGHDPHALVNCRRQLFITACNWIATQEEMHRKLLRAWKGVWNG